jgi:hypothetical protein
VGLGGEVHYGAGPMLEKYTRELVTPTDIYMLEEVPRIGTRFGQGLQVASI